jgi:hypothetical protein
MSTRADAVDLTELEEDGETQEQQEQQEQSDVVPAPESSKKRRRNDVVEATQGWSATGRCRFGTW